jgi:hypothetical protein
VESSLTGNNTSIEYCILGTTDKACWAGSLASSESENNQTIEFILIKHSIWHRL